jgi:5-methylcytosine-specific restriction endonuclease McrA
MKLRRNERCPIHKSLFCCGREQIKKVRKSWTAVQRIEDPHHPRGYRERRSPAEMKTLLKRKIAEQGMKCGICGNDLIDFSDVVPDHKDPKGMGSARRDDHPDNIQAAHRRCNLDKGSRRLQPNSSGVI